MKRLLLMLVPALAPLAGCGSPSPAAPSDQTLSRLNHAGDTAFRLEQPAQAVDQYKAALDRARVRDDAAAIADAGFNLATAELRANQPENALGTTRELKAELARRGVVDADFDLVSATALFRLGDFPAADRIAAGLVGRKDRAQDPALGDAAWFLRGLIASARGDRAGLEAAATSLSLTADAADVAELRARLNRDPSLALQAADLRRDRLDYRGMVRALALAGEFTDEPSKAADLYLRAGRSAAGQNDLNDARLWLAKARDLAADPVVRDEAAAALQRVATR